MSPRKPLARSDSNASTRSSSSSGSEHQLPLSFYGWINVANGPTGKYCRRYCKLRDVVCCFYDQIGDELNANDRHLILRVDRLAGVNHGIKLINHQNRTLHLYTDTAEEFTTWTRAFDEAIHAAKASPLVRRRSFKNSISKEIENLSPAERTEAKRRFNNPSIYVINTKQLERNQKKEKTTTRGWLMKQSSSLFGKKMQRRYFVITGSELAYYEINLQGQDALGGGIITSCKPWASSSQEHGLQIQLLDKTSLFVAAKNHEDMQEWLYKFRFHALE